MSLFCHLNHILYSSSLSTRTLCHKWIQLLFSSTSSSPCLGFFSGREPQVSSLRKSRHVINNSHRFVSCKTSTCFTPKIVLIPLKVDLIPLKFSFFKNSHGSRKIEVFWTVYLVKLTPYFIERKKYVFGVNYLFFHLFRDSNFDPPGVPLQFDWFW